METHLSLMGPGGDGGGGAVFSGVSATGSLSTVSKEENLAMSSEDSSSYPDESELELGLGLGVGGAAVKSKPAVRGQYARILTAKDFPSMAVKSSPSSASSSSSVSKANPSCGTKRAADSVSPPRSGVSQVVGWPPVGSYRMNSLANPAKSAAAEEFSSLVEKSKTKGVDGSCLKDGSNKNYEAKENGKTSLFVKVNMDGTPIGRKIDLNAHASYEALAQVLKDMFFRSSMSINARHSGTNVDERGFRELSSSTRLLDGSSEFVLTYEDKEGDWMLVGDVPWEMFLGSVKRLKIMKTSEANGLAPRFEGRNGRQRTKPI